MSLATAGHVRRAIASRGPAQLPFVAWSGAYQGGCDERSSGLSTGEMATAQFRGLSVWARTYGCPAQERMMAALI